MKSRIILKEENNKRSRKDLSFSLKALSVVFLLGALFLNSFLVKVHHNKNDQKNLSINHLERYSFGSDEDLFIKPIDAHQEFFDFILTQENTFIAAIPLSFPKVQVLGVQSGENGKEIISYQVQSGDSIASVAEKFDISTETILWANDLSSNSKLKVGQELIILPVSGIYHIVKSGENIGGIAQRYKAKEEDIVSFNEVDQIMVGDILIVPGGKMSQNIAPRASQPQMASSGFIIPARGYISQGLHWHNAVDIANSCGTPIYAAANGTIQQVGYGGIAGNYIRISHPNGLVTFYGHLSRTSVSRGQKVSQGNVIGYMGNTGYTIGPTGCHLHFEVRGGKNPLAGYRVGHRF